ncbi:hypothetical protein AYR62_11375 [Secundilactobacillus paracollinoides]|uniref:N-acetylmuramoyl-L-alanine amidase n=1 Tax=Secundilactobacillus paracollinoides TaxID=240427 RepID=A0A1B2IXS9_9LACO|nr:peptidoglycan recognition family protein [Secundilactobacillus paracollinoides]ANZ61019.1 hypothetical protein AYR61_06465 [Secundilactobacillus paracollinoides]ANZ64618.1 hypothetical protein AYR62_11375 [Secundilactobacillus paracollinoides]ANZ66876.1 hypothetical protein AYR63_06825 [Secundilactobacillus paracollinoides]KRL79552.1 hypothetical protein FC17_GL000379 [Secundilactobacillus paracollinoides DSM 15502 = JCM 11969]
MQTNEVSAAVSNYTQANRPDDVPVTHIVIHSTELSYLDTVRRFQEDHEVSAHDVIRGADGLVTRMVAPENVAWHAGNWELNCRSVGIEQEAYVGEPESFTETMLRSLATVVAQLSQTFHVPLDRDHLLGHDNLCAATPDGQLAMHQDPGRYFDWQGLMKGLWAPVISLGTPQIGEPVVVCVNVADLYQSPDTGAELLTSESLPAWTHQLSYGQRYVCAERSGEWVAIWYNGVKGWCHDPEHTILQGCQGEVIAPNSPHTPIFGMTSAAAKPIATLAAEEQYVAGPLVSQLESRDTNGQFQASFTGQRYYQFYYNHRIAFVPIDTMHLVKKE